MTDTLHVQRGIDQHNAQAAMTVATLSLQLRDVDTLAKAHRKAHQDKRAALPEYEALESARAELRNATKELRLEEAAAKRELQAAIDATDWGKRAIELKCEKAELKAKLEAAHADNRQTLMAFAQ